MKLEECKQQLGKIMRVLSLRPNPCLQCPLAIKDADGGVYTPIVGDGMCGICNRGTWEIGDRSIEVEGETIPMCRECEVMLKELIVKGGL